MFIKIMASASIPFAMAAFVVVFAVFAVASAVGGVTMAANADAGDVAFPVVLSAGIVDPKHNCLYINNKSHGIDALNLDNGGALWTSDQRTKPLLVTGKQLVTWLADDERPNVVRILVLDATTGKQLLVSDPITLPIWVDTNPMRYGCTCSFRGCLDHGNLVFSWQASTSMVGGTIMAGGTMPALAQKRGCGAFAVNLKTGDIQALEPSHLPVFSGPEIPQFRMNLSTLHHLEETWQGRPLALSYQDVTPEDHTSTEQYAVYKNLLIELDNKTVTEPQPPLKGSVNGKLVSIDQPPEQHSVLLFRSWDLKTGKPCQFKTLMDSGFGRMELSEDRQYLCVGEGERAGTEISIFSLETGDLIAKVAPCNGTPAYTWKITADGSHLMSYCKDRAEILIFSLANGKPIGKIPLDAPAAQPSLSPYYYADISIWNSRAFVTIRAGVSVSDASGARTLKVFDLSSASPLWQREIEGKPYPVPPA